MLPSGGSLGWKVRGSLLQDFEKVAYELEPSSKLSCFSSRPEERADDERSVATGSPKIGECKTGEGYHIIMVEGRK